MADRESKREKRVYSSTLAKWSGLAAILAGMLFAAWGYFNIAQGVLGAVVPLLFLLGLAGLRTRCAGRAGWLGEAGFFLGFVALVWGGTVRPFVDMTAFYRYFVGEGWPPWLSNWFAWLVIGLIMVGVAATKTKALRGYGILTLMIGSFGWLFFSTGSGGAIETYFGHVTFGALLCLSWIALGYALCRDTGRSNYDPDAPSFQEQARAASTFVSSFAVRVGYRK